MRRSPGIETFLCRYKSVVCIHHAEEFLPMNTLQQTCQKTLVTQTRALLNFTRKAERVSQRQKRLLTYCCWRVMLYYAEIFVRKEVKWRFPIRLAGTVRGEVGAVLDLFRSPNIEEFDFVVVVKVNKTVYLQLVSVFFRLFFVFFFSYLNTPVWDRSRNAHRLLPSSLFP